ncbi:MAG TPA: hypothetical protein VGN23_12250 [Verrucomicrobiae bacterium]
MSRNALIWFIFFVIGPAALPVRADSFSLPATNSIARVVIVNDANAMFDYQPIAGIVQDMVNRGITSLAANPNVSAAWLSFVSTNDIIGIKVFSTSGEISGARPAVTAAVIHGLLGAGIPASHIIIWDKDRDDLHAAGYYTLGRHLGVRVASGTATGYDPTNFYLPDSPVIGVLHYGDLEFGQKGKDIGKKSYVTKLVSRQITKIISIVPLMNNNDVGVFGHLFNVAIGSVDNTYRFEEDAGRLANAVPEIYALQSVGDKVVLNITDALIGQYEGGPNGLLQYSDVLNQLWFSRDPVALDTLGANQLKSERDAHDAAKFDFHTDLYTNAALLELGFNDPAKISVEKVK